MSETNRDSELGRIRARLAELEAERVRLERRLAELREAPHTPETTDRPTIQSDHEAMSNAEKITLFRALFAGRADVFPKRWENPKTGRSGYAPACANEWVRGVCDKPRVKCGVCPSAAFVPVTDVVVGHHLRGEIVAGVYPVLSDDTCRFLVADFDGEGWAADALAYVDACREVNVTAALERSRSGDGCHVWTFFSEPVVARNARRLGACLLTAAMDVRPEIGFASYDRLFPSQDTVPAGGFGNLIALPLQRRAADAGNSLFVDNALRPYDDQWTYLAALPRTSPATVTAVIAEAESCGRVLGVRMPVEDEHADEPWSAPPSRKLSEPRILGPLPDRVRVILADDLYIDRSELPSAMVARLVRIAAFQNPEFYRAQAMRFSTHGKPRIVSCAVLHPKHVALPRGCLDEALELLRSNGVQGDLEDRREPGAAIDVRFLGSLRDEQIAAVSALAPHDTGVLAATTGFGKTVIGAAMIAQRRRNTLVLVHRRELLTQWTERLRTFLSVGPEGVGIIGGGKRMPTGIIDVALIQSLVRKGEVADIISGYGHLIVDECHHLSAASFELAARRSKARYVLGLSATVARKDGHHPIIFMQCGPVRHRIDPKSQAKLRAFEHHVIFRETSFRLPPDLASAPSMPALYAALAKDEERNAMIFDDVMHALQAGRSPLVLTERRDHLELLRERFTGFARTIVVLQGGMGTKERRAADELLRVSEGKERLILATGRYLGEGFDDARLDTLFLAMPISWKGTLAQYIGRLHREHAGKRNVVVCDYVDANVPVLARMAQKRRAGYRGEGYGEALNAVP